MDKIYSRNKRFYIPRFNGFNIKKDNKNSKKKRIVFATYVIIITAVLTAKYIVEAISPIIDRQCIYMAKIIATRVSNEQASIAMAKYKYEDICTITKDTNR